MSEGPSVLFPLILDALSHKPLLSETQNNLLKDLKEKLNREGIKVRNLKKELDAAIDIGRGLGILTVQDEEVRMPFLLNGRTAFANIRLVNRPPNEASARSKSAPGSSENNKQKRESGYKDGKNENNSDEEGREKYRNQVRSRSRSRSRRRSRIRSKSRKRSVRSRRRAR